MAEASAGPGPLRLPPEVVEIAATLERAGHETWAVGGALRDLLLGIAETDVDLATAAPPEVVQSLFRRTVPVGLKYGTVGVLDARNRLHEVTTFRQDVETDGRHAVVRYGVSLRDDLARRDFTINAIAYHPIREEWQDPYGGREDLQAGLVRAVGNPADRFREDYLRILRAVRFSARFGFTIEPATWAAAISAAPGLAGLSAERVRDEWFKGLRTAVSLSRLVELWHEVGAAAVWLDGVAVAYPGADPAPVQRDPVVLTALLTADPAAVLRRLHASGEEIARAHAMAAAVEPASTEPADVRRWLAAVGPAADDLLLLEWFRRGEDAPWAQMVTGIRARGEATNRGALAVSGHDLLGAGMTAGPQVGAALDRLLDRVLDDPGLNTRERLLELVRSWN